MQRTALAILVVFGMLTTGIELTPRETPQRHEQHSFSVEQELVPIEKPSQLPQQALKVLAKEAGVASCLQNEDLPSDQLPSSWFVASEIHLNGPNEVDFVVLPNLTSEPEQHPGPAACFLGANTGQFWIVRKTRRGYQLALTLFTHALTVLDSRSNGLCDIEAVTISVNDETTTVFKFKGQRYRRVGGTLDRKRQKRND